MIHRDDEVRTGGFLLWIVINHLYKLYGGYSRPVSYQYRSDSSWWLELHVSLSRRQSHQESSWVQCHVKRIHVRIRRSSSTFSLWKVQTCGASFQAVISKWDEVGEEVTAQKGDLCCLPMCLCPYVPGPPMFPGNFPLVVTRKPSFHRSIYFHSSQGQVTSTVLLNLLVSIHLFLPANLAATPLFPFHNSHH